MSKQNNPLLDIWNTYATSILNEKTNSKLGKKEGSGAKDLNDPANTKFQHKDSGPEKAEGFEAPVDPAKKKKSKKAGVENIGGVEKFSSDDKKIDESIEKNTSTIINNCMKSIFDKLFEEVMNDQELQDADTLGVDVDDEASDLEDTEGSEDVTITLTQDQVSVLRDILAQVEGDLEDEGLEDEGLEDEGLEDEGEDSDDEDGFDFSFGGGEVKEGVDAEVVGTPIKDSKKLEKGFVEKGKNKVGNLKVKSGKADSKVTDKITNNEALPDSKGQSLTKKSNKVNGKASKPGASAFEL